MRVFTVFLFQSFSVFLFVGPISGQTEQAKLISSTEYLLSEKAEAAGIDGTIKVAITVNKQGVVENPRIIAGPSWPCSTRPIKELTEVESEIKKNLLAAKFTPAVKDGKPIENDLLVTFKIGEAYRRELRKQKNAEAASIDPSAKQTIQGGVINGKAKSLPKPMYPSEARASRASGLVTVEVLIDERGKVVKAGAVSGHPALQYAARDAACDAKFSPTLLKGQPVKVAGVITYYFVP